MFITSHTVYPKTTLIVEHVKVFYYFAKVWLIKNQMFV